MNLLKEFDSRFWFKRVGFVHGGSNSKSDGKNTLSPSASIYHLYDDTMNVIEPRGACQTVNSVEPPFQSKPNHYE
jgi:hypothetical protein